MIKISSVALSMATDGGAMTSLRILFFFLMLMVIPNCVHAWDDLAICLYTHC